MAAGAAVSPSLAGFVSARLDEREALALAVPAVPGAIMAGSDDPGYAAPFIAAHDRAWVLRDVAAKRAILAMYLEWKPAKPHREDPHGLMLAGLEAAVMRIAAIDRDHPGCDPGWAVT